jgi:ribonuclease P protein component
VPSCQPLRGDRAFSAVFRRGRREDGQYVAVRVLPNGLGCNRLGFNIGRKLGKAVDRNRIRRRLRHIIADLHPEEGWDLVLIANARTVLASYVQLKEEAAGLLLSAGVSLNERGELAG